MLKGIQNLINQLQSVINGIKMGILVIVNLVKQLIELLKLTFTTFGNTITLITTLPTWLVAFATVTVSVAVLYLVLGREPGK